MVPFLTFLALEIRIVLEILHQIKNDYAECYLLSIKTHRSMTRWPWCSGECYLTVTPKNIIGPSPAPAW